MLEDGRALAVVVEVDSWSAWLVEDSRTHVIGVPLEGVLMEVVGLDPAHDEPPEEILRLAHRIRVDVPRAHWPARDSNRA